MTSDLLAMQNHLAELNQVNAERQRQESMRAAQAQSDEQFESLLQRLDKLRQSAGQRRAARMAAKRLRTSQGSFVF